MSYPEDCPFTEMYCWTHGSYGGLKGRDTPCFRCVAEEKKLEAIVERVVRRVLAEHKGGP